MNRIETRLRAGVAVAAIIGSCFRRPGAKHAAAGRRPERAGRRRHTANAQGDIVVTGSRIRRDPLDHDAPVVFVDQADIAKTGLNSVNDVLQRLPSAGGGLNGKFNNSGNFGNPPDGGGVGAGSAEIDLRYLGSQAHARAGRRPALRQRRLGERRARLGRPQLHPRKHDRADRGAAGRRLGDLRLRRHRRRRQHHHQEASRRASSLPRSSANISTRATASRQNYQLSWGNGGDGPTQIVVGGNYREAGPDQLGRPRDLALPDAICDRLRRACSSGTPLGRFIVGNHQSVRCRRTELTLKAPVIGRAPTLADYRAFQQRRLTVQLRAVQLHPDPARALRRVRQLQAGTGSATSTSRARRSTTGAIRRTRRRRCRCSSAPTPATATCSTRSTIDAPTRSTRSGVDRSTTPTQLLRDFIGRRVVESRAAPLQPEGRHLSTATARSTASSDCSAATGIGTSTALYGRNKAKQTMLGNINARQPRRSRSARSRPAPRAAACRSTFSAARARSPRRCSITSPSTSTTAASRSCGTFTRQRLRQPCSICRAAPLGLAFGVEHRDQKGRFDPDPVVAAGLGSDIPALPTNGGYNVDEAYAELNAPLLAHRPSSSCSS